MEFTPEQLKTVETLASINYSTEKIALYLDVEYRDFIREFSHPGSRLKH